MTELQAQTVNDIKAKVQAAATERGVQLPKVWQRECDDGSVSLEYITRRVRLFFNVEVDPAESGWGIVGEGLMEWGYMRDLDIPKLVELWVAVPERA